jgi:outer membrane immunogenic protein
MHHSQLGSLFGLIAAAAFSGSALADGYAGGSVKDAPEAAFTWTGFYVGGHAGLATGDTEGRPESLSLGNNVFPIQGPIATFLSTDYDMNGGVYGGHVGYNKQFNSLVLGIEGSFSGSEINGDGPLLLGFLTTEREVDWLATVTGRVGYAMGRSLVYGRAGVAFGDVSSDVKIGGFSLLSGDETHVGWTIGAGYEYAISDHVTFRVEYAHVDLGAEDHTLTFPGVPANVFNVKSDVDVKLDTLQVGVSYKF